MMAFQITVETHYYYYYYYYYYCYYYYYYYYYSAFYAQVRDPVTIV